MSVKSKLPIKCWKSLYMKLTSVKVRYRDEVIEKELSGCEDNFQQGIFQFSSSVPTSHVELRENKNSTFMESFYQRLSKILKVDLDASKEIFANYLLYNCNNARSLLQERLEKNIRAVLLSTWSFQAQERIFFLKCYLHVISSSMDPNAPYSDVFKKFLSSVSMRDRYSSILKQFNKVIQQELPSTNDYGVLADLLIPLWVSYNLREQLELLHILILLTSKIDVELNDIDDIVNLLQITSFGRYQCFFYHHSHLSDNQILLQNQIRNAITLYAVQILSIGWKTDIYKENNSKFSAHDKILYPKSYSRQQGPFVIAWILILYNKLMNSSAYDEQLSNQSFILLDDDLWKGIDDALQSNIMDIPIIAKIIEPVIDEMVYEMFTKFGIVAFQSQLTLSSIIAFFCKFHTLPFNKSTTAVLHHFRDRFPLDCCCLFKILGSVLNWTTENDHRKEVLQLMNHLKYSVRREDCKLKSVELNKYVLDCEFIPLKCISRICIPRGTAVVPDFEENIITVQKSLPIWDVMRNYLTMYLNGDVDDELMHIVTEIINFVYVSLQKMKIINNDILQFSELVVHVIWKSSNSCNLPKELELLAACIKLHSILFCIMPEDIIKCFEIYNFIPGYPVRMKHRDVQIHDMYYTQSRIYTIVCNTESKTGDYPVLFAYLHFFHNVVQNMFESWYTVAGLKFIFHVYSNVNNDFWKFKNLDDRNLIIWHCIEILHEILNHGLKDLYEVKNTESLIDFKELENEYVVPTTYFISKSCVSSILSNVNESTVLSTATIGDAALLETIIESACWNRGKSAIFINTITYALSLVQRCLIYINVENKLKKVEICIDHLFQPEKCLSLLSYRYNCFSDTISLLAIKLLIKLASIKDNCMFSWLQYSNDLLQKEFLYPLYSSNESNSVKSSMLALMAVCIVKQIVIADALLEIDKVRKICIEKSSADNKWQNLLVFASKYIHDIEKTPDKYLSSMHCAILNVIHACWVKKLKVPQQYFKMSKEFWTYLLLPFHTEPYHSFNGYSFILETVCLEIIGAKTLDPNLESEIKSFLNSKWFMQWTKFCADVIDEESRLTVEFESIPNPISAISESWKKFMKMIATNYSSLIEKPSETAFPVLEDLIVELADSQLRKKKKFLCDIYRIYLATWEKNCSETKWQKELDLTNQMFVLLNKFHQEYKAPYFFSALLEIGYKVLKFGTENSQMHDGFKDAPGFLLACGGILNQELEKFSKRIVDEEDTSFEYPPLLLHLCICIDVIENLNVPAELMSFVLREIDFMGQLLNINNHILTAGCTTRTTKMLLQFQNYMFERYHFVKVNYSFSDAVLMIYQAVFPSEAPQEQVTNLIEIFKDSEKNNLYTYGLRFILNLTKEKSRHSKSLLLEFHAKNKLYLYTVFEMIGITLRKEDLRLMIAVASFYRRISQNIHYCKYSEVNDLVEALFLLFNCVKTAVSMIVQPSKMCSLLFNVPTHLLQQFFDENDNSSRVLSTCENTYKNLMWLVQIGMQTLFTFCFDGETILNGYWPSEDWNFRWLNKILDKNGCIFPLLFLNQDNLQEDFTTLATYITLEHRALTNRITIAKPLSPKNLVGNKLTLIDFDKSGDTLSAVSRFLLAQSAMYLLHPQIDQPKKLFFVNQIFVNLKEFIRNAINDAVNVTIEVPLPVENDELCGDESVPTVDALSGNHTSTPVESIPTRQVLSLRGVHSKPPIIAASNVQLESGDTGPDMEKLHVMELNIVARLFFKLITTFKHS